MANVAKRSVLLAGHKTSVSLEEEFWTALKEIAQEKGVSVSGLVLRIDGARESGNLSSALRTFVLDHYRARAAVSAQPALLDQPGNGREGLPRH